MGPENVPKGKHGGSPAFDGDNRKFPTRAKPQGKYEKVREVAQEMAAIAAPLKSNFEKVREFHWAFKHPVRLSPQVPSNAERLARVNFLLEEVKEFCDASGVEVMIVVKRVSDNAADINLVEVADALADIEYVTHGAALVWGIPSQRVFDEVHHSNMTKLGADGKPVYREDGKILKGPNYRPPDVKKAMGFK